jgi:hypothetical protein
VIEDARQPIENRIDVGADEQPPELVVVRRVRDDREVDVRRDLMDPVRQRRAACASG